MEINDVKSKLSEIVSPDYKWPEVPLGWQLEFIAYSNTEVDLDLLHPVSGVFWTNYNDYIDPPIMLDGNPITATALSKAGVPFMTTFGHARAVDRPASCHLSIVKKGSN